MAQWISPSFADTPGTSGTPSTPNAGLWMGESEKSLVSSTLCGEVRVEVGMRTQTGERHTDVSCVVKDLNQRMSYCDMLEHILAINYTSVNYATKHLRLSTI